MLFEVGFASARRESRVVGAREAGTDGDSVMCR
jgi:hypothetical protein